MTATMFSRWRLLVCGVVVASAFVFVPSPAAADKGPYWETSKAARASKKLIRGFCNLICAPVEIPKEIINEWQRTDPFTGLWLGFAKGLFHMGKRVCFGFYDIMTFPFPKEFEWDRRIDPEVVLLDRID